MQILELCFPAGLQEAAMDFMIEKKMKFLIGLFVSMMLSALWSERCLQPLQGPDRRVELMETV